MVDRLLDEARGRAVGGPAPPRALIAPHAGYAYSGAVAASAFAALATTRPTRVLLLGPSHHFGLSGAAVPSKAHAQRTPLGEVPFDRAAIERLAASPEFAADDRYFVPEHALEAELPFLQRIFGPDVPVVPILVGGAASRVASAIAPLAADGALAVVSSDFTHYGPRFGYVPFADDVPERLRDLDLGAADAIARGDAEAFARHVDATGATICGRRAIDVLLHLDAGRRGGRLVEYDTSGRMTGSFDHSVSYASMALAS